FDPSWAFSRLDELEAPLLASVGLTVFHAETSAPPWERLPVAPKSEILWRCKTRQNLTGASLPQIRRRVARAWRLTLALRTSEARDEIDRIELQLDDVSAAVARRIHRATQLLRAVGLAL